jgi:DNA polymerase-3 subunit beta
MKVSCSQRELLTALNIVNKAVNSTNTLPVLGNILLKAEKDRLFFAATNLELAITYDMEATVKEEGAITVPARLISSFVALLNDKEVEMSVTKSMELFIESASSQTKIKGIDSEEFPIISISEADKTLTLSSEQLLHGINQTCFAAAVNTARPALSGILFKVSTEELILVGTDSFRLAEKKIKLNKKNDFEGEYVIPSRTIAELGKILEKFPEKNLTIKFAEKQVLFEVDKALVSSRIIEAKFPDYAQIIPRTHNTLIASKGDELSMAIRRTILFAREGNHSVKFLVNTDGKLSLQTEETHIGQEKTDLQVKLEGSENNISLNAQYLLDALTSLGEKEIAIEMIDKDAPAVMKGVNDDSYLYLVMPLKSNS